MGLNELIQTVTFYSGSSEAKSMLTTAFQVASDAHDGFQRINGEPYLNHAMAVAGILAEWHAPLPVVVTGLLHDILNPDYSRERNLDQVHAQFGSDIFHLLEAIVNLNSFIRLAEGDFDSGADASDIRDQMISFVRQESDAVAIKIADRLHNLETISALTHSFQERTARIGLNLLSPLANRIGMETVKRQLEDSCFKILYPKYYKMMQQHFAEADIQEEIQSILKELQYVFSSSIFKCQVRWQTAALYTFYHDQIEHNPRLDKSVHLEFAPLRIVDAGSFIILIDEELDCYRVLGTLHKLYTPVERQFRDFIGHPKGNGYRSLHTQVKHASGRLFGVIIRTHTMDLIAERGITARWWNVPEELLPQFPKESKPANQGFLQVFTPQGEIKYLPQGATVLDFAYAIHTDVGHRCVGAFVNGERADLSRMLHPGDKVEILSGGPDAIPNLGWLEIVRTSRATSRIRQWLIQHQRNATLERGRSLLDKELQPLGLDSTDVEVRRLLIKLALREKVKDIEDFLAAIGAGRYKASKLVERLKSMRLKSVGSPNYIEPTFNVNVLSPEEALLPRAFAQCCKPVPSDDIVGYRRTDHILAIHKRTCPQIKEVEKLTPVQWDTTPTEPNYVVVVEALNRPGLASDLSTVIALLGFDMPGFSAYKRADGVMAEAHIHLGKTTTTQRSRIQKALEDVSYVTKVEVIHASFLSAPTAQPESSRPIHRSNPYGPTIAVGSRFYGREVECERISANLRDLSQNTAILLWGQKRIGKTSLVLRFEEQMRGTSLPVYIDVQGLKDGSTTQFLHQLMIGIARALKDKVLDPKQEISVPALNRLRKDPLPYFDTFIAMVQEAARHHPLVVILDEFQCLCSLQEEVVSRSAILSRLRSHSQHAHGIHFILSGGGLRSQLVGQCDISSLFNIAHNEKLGCLEAEAAHQLIKDGLARVGRIAEYAIQLLLDLTAGHPFYLQLLCSMLYDYAQENKSIITFHAASQRIRDWLDKADANRFQHLWEGHDTTSAQRNKLILSAIAQLNAHSHQVEYDRLASAIGSTVSEKYLVSSLEDLADLGVLEHDHSNYTIKVELFARWLRQHWPLELALKEARWL